MVAQADANDHGVTVGASLPDEAGADAPGVVVGEPV
jgi:hypothetical protein